MKQKDIREAMRVIGSKGGKAGTGKSKVRGDSAYYSRLGKMGARNKQGRMK